MKNPEDLNIVFIGAGAIGGSAGAWVAEKHANTYLLARGAAADEIAAQGVTLYQAEEPERKEFIPVKVIRDLKEVPGADVVVIGVKLYDLEPVAQQVQAAVGDRALVVGLQNGLAAEEILPRYFSRAAFGVVTYNAWLDAPGVIGYQRRRDGSRGAILLGALDPALMGEVRALAALFNQGLETEVTERIRDAAHCKLAINLANSVTTLLGPDPHAVGDLDAFQDILANTIYEGVEVIRAAGVREVRAPGLPSWRTLWAAAKLPHAITRGVFRRNLEKMNISSMGQDVYQRGRSETELEYLNGYLLKLADEQHMVVPYNRTVYRLCKERFAAGKFEPMAAREVREEIKKH